MEEGDRLRRVFQQLREAAGKSGLLRFDRFMEIALYAPTDGYYMRDRTAIGRDGDFYTAPQASPLFGATLARWVRSWWERSGRPDRFQLVEVGPGDGTLALDLASALAPLSEHSDAQIEQILVERSPSPQARIERRFAETFADARGKVRFAPSLSSLGPVRGVIVANELLDAFPCRRLVWRSDGFHELAVRVGEETTEWAEVPVMGAVPPPALPTPEEAGTVLEVSPSAEAFIREVADHLAEGAAVLLDYGAEESELLARFPSGTLAAVERHRSREEPLLSPGSADLSTFVNFSRVRHAAHRGGLTEIAYERQAEALGRWGFPTAREESIQAARTDEARVRLNLGAKNLLFGFENFRILELSP